MLYKTIRCLIDQKISLKRFNEARKLYGEPTKCQCCGKYGLGEYWVCQECGWEQDYALDLSSDDPSVNYSELNYARERYQKIK